MDRPDRTEKLTVVTAQAEKQHEREIERHEQQRLERELGGDNEAVRAVLQPSSAANIFWVQKASVLCGDAGRPKVLFGSPSQNLAKPVRSLRM